MAHLHQAVAFDGAFEILGTLRRSSQTIYVREEFLDLMRANGVSGADASLHELVAGGLLVDRGESISLTQRGIRTCLLIEAINGADLNHVLRQLSRLDSSLRTYELVREGMTRIFIRNLNERPGFGRLYFCSPWINLYRDHAASLANAVHRNEQRHGRLPEILVITRPEQGTDLTVPATLEPFQALGATVWLSKRLHSKLYIREPDLSGGYSMAIVGSQNLTRSNYLELGIRVNADSAMINQLISYFWELTAHSDET